VPTGSCIPKERSILRVINVKIYCLFTPKIRVSLSYDRYHVPCPSQQAVYSNIYVQTVFVEILLSFQLCYLSMRRTYLYACNYTEIASYKCLLSPIFHLMAKPTLFQTSMGLNKMLLKRKLQPFLPFHKNTNWEYKKCSLFFIIFKGQTFFFIYLLSFFKSNQMWASFM
jgi:hypothetical protein